MELYPPPPSSCCSDIVKLTAQFVARNGTQFLDKLMMKEQVGIKIQHAPECLMPRGMFCVG